MATKTSEKKILFFFQHFMQLRSMIGIFRYLQINVLSPSLFSLHYKGKGIERETSIPHLLKTMANDDYVDWLDFIADASGVTNAIERIEVSIESKTDQ